MKTIALVCFLLAAVAVGVTAAPVVAPGPPRVATLADPEVQTLVARMYEKMNEMMMAGRQLVQENERLERENETLKAKLACS